MPGRRIGSKPPTKKKTVKANDSADERVTFDTVRQISLSLDHAEEGTSYGTAAFKVRGALFVRLHQDFESTIVVRTDFEQREELLAGGSRDVLHHRSLSQLRVGARAADTRATGSLARSAAHGAPACSSK